MKIKLRRGWICLKMNLTKFMKLLMKKIVQLPVYNPFFKKLKNILKILCRKKNWKGSMFLIKLKPQFWNSNYQAKSSLKSNISRKHFCLWYFQKKRHQKNWSQRMCSNLTQRWRVFWWNLTKEIHFLAKKSGF